MANRRSHNRSRWRPVDIGLRLMIPIGFAVLTLFNVVSLTHEGSSPKIQNAGPAFPTAAKEVKVATVGEIGSDQSAQQTLRQMADQRPDLYLALGDLGYTGVGSERHWCTLVRDEVGFVSPFELAAGQSEEDGSHDGRISAYSACLPDRLNATGQYGRQYYIDIGNLARFIVVSPNLTLDGIAYSYAHGDPEYAWLASAIDTAHSEGIEWVVVAMNQDCISSGVYYCNIDPALLSLLLDKRVDLVLSAHDHTYQRSQQLATGTPGCPSTSADSFDIRCVADNARNGRFRRGGGTIFVVAGSASSNLYPITQKQPDAHYLATTMGQNKDPSPGSLLLTLSKSSLSGNFVRTKGGTFADQFTISASVTPPPTTSHGSVRDSRQEQASPK